MQKWFQPPTCLDHGLHVLKQRSFPPNRATQMWERYQLFFGLRLMSKEFQHFAIQTKIEQRQPTGRQDSMQNVFRTCRGWIHFCIERLRTLKSFQIFKTEIKKSKTYSGWCSFQGLSSWYHSHVKPIWLDGTFMVLILAWLTEIFF